VYAGGIQEEMSRMNTYERSAIYRRGGRALTPRQRRRLIKNAGKDPYAVVVRDDGMGFPPSMQGYRELVFAEPADA
jgi:hypothetical protein